jgi:acyl carrier protein
MADEVENIRAFVVENFLFGDDSGLLNSTSFREEGIVDSTGILELVAFVESSFGIQVEGDEYIPANLDSIEKVAAFVIRKRS